MDEAHGIEVVERPMNELERQQLSLFAENWNETQLKIRREKRQESAMVGTMIALGGLLAAFLIGGTFMIATGLFISVAGLSLAARGVLGLSAPEQPSNPWENHHIVTETTIHASRIATAVDADGPLWCLFDLNDGRWFTISDEYLPYIDRLEDLVDELSHEKVSLTQLGQKSEFGTPLTIVGTGNRIPHRGIQSYDSLDYAIAAGYCWSPPFDSNEGKGYRDFELQTNLPPWMWS